MSLVESMDLESRRCEQSIHDSRRLSHEFNEVVALLTQWRDANARLMAIRKLHQPHEKLVALNARIDKCLAALKGQKGA